MASFNQKLMRVMNAIENLQSDCGDTSSYVEALKTLIKISTNLQQSDDQKFRTLNTSAAALRSKLTKYVAGQDILKAIGFTARPDDDARWELTSQNEDKDFIETAVSLLQRALKQQSQPSTTSSTPPITSPVSPQEQADREYSLQLQRQDDQSSSSSSSSSNITANPTAMQIDDQEITTINVEQEKDLRADLNPTYNISEVRRALTALRQQINADPHQMVDSNEFTRRLFYVSCLTILSKITANLLKPDKESKYRTLNLRNDSLSKHIAAYEGATEYLSFLGFIRCRDATSDTMTLDASDEDSQRITRALSVLNRVLTEVQPSEEEREQHAMGPVEREPRLMRFEQALLNEKLAPPEAEAPESLPSDMVLMLAVATEDRRRNEMMSRTDAFFNKNKQAELKARYRRKYSRTLARVIFTNENTILTAYFRPWETLEPLFDLVRSQLSDPTVKFVLRSPPQTKLTSADVGKTFQSFGMVPSATLYFAVENDADMSRAQIKPELIEAREPMQTIPIPVADNAAEINEKRKQDRMGPAGVVSSSPSSSSANDDDIDDDEVERRMAAINKKARSAASNPRPISRPTGNQ